MKIRNERGSALAMAILVLGASVGVSYILLGKSDLLRKRVAQAQKNIRVEILKEKFVRMGGFLVANNLILCKSSAWNNGQAEKTCLWNKKNYATSSKSYDPKDFGLIGPSFEGNLLKFSIDEENLFLAEQELNILAPKKSWISFQLISQNDIASRIGAKLGKQQEIDFDEDLILMQGQIITQRTQKKSYPFKAAFKRPLAVPQVKVTSSSCLQRCDISLTENLNPPCRSDFYTAKDTLTDISAVTKNLGPGALYALKYHKQVAFYDGVKLHANSSNTNAPAVDVNVGDYILPGGSLVWADNVPCGNMSITREETVRNNLKNRDDVFWVFTKERDFADRLLTELFDSIFPKIQAQTMRRVFEGRERVFSGSTVSQHSNPAGTVIYELDGQQDRGFLEPFRMTDSLESPPQEVSGLAEVTTNTYTMMDIYTWVYVAPPH